MALPPTFAARVRSSTVPMAERRIGNRGLADGLTLLGREGATAVARREQADAEIAASEGRIAERELARDRQHAAIQAGARATDAQVRLADGIGELERNAAPGGEGHVDAVREKLAEERTTLLSELPDDEELRGRAMEQWHGYEARVLIRAQEFEAGQRVQRDQNDFAAMAQNGERLVHDDPAPESFASQLATEFSFIDAMPITGNDKQTIRRERGGRLAQAMIAGLIEQGRFDEAEALRGSEELRPFLSRQDAGQLGRLIENGRSVQAREAEIAAQVQRDAVQQEVDLIDAQIAAGATDIGAARLQQVYAAAKATGFEKADLFEIENWSIRQEVNRRYSSVTELNGGIRALDARAAEGKLNVNGQIQLQHMRDRRDTLLSDRSDELRGQWREGGAARLSVLDELYQMPLADRAQVAAGLDGGNLRYAVHMSQAKARMAVLGAEARKADKTLVPTDAASEQMQRRIFDETIGGALTSMRPTDRMALYDLAKDYYAYMASEQGASAFDQTVFRTAIGRVLGREGRGETATGGLGRWRSEAVWLPDGVTQRGFDHDLARHDFAGAIEPPDVIRRKYTPVWVRDADEGGSVYRFRDESGAELGKAGGGAYELRVWR